MYKGTCLRVMSLESPQVTFTVTQYSQRSLLAFGCTPGCSRPLKLMNAQGGCKIVPTLD